MGLTPTNLPKRLYPILRFAPVRESAITKGVPIIGPVHTQLAKAPALTEMRTEPSKRHAVIAILFLITMLSLCLAGFSALKRVPWSDEGQFSSAAYNLAHRGFFGTTVLDPSTIGLTRIQQRTYWVMPLFLLGQALWYKLFPATLFWTRAFSLLWAPVALFAFYRVLISLAKDVRVAGLATVLLALDYHFIDNAGFARPDLMCLALGVSSFAVYLYFRSWNLPFALFSSNLLVAASALTHPNALLYLAGLVILICCFDIRRIRIRHVAAAGAAYVVLGLLYGIYVFQDPAAWRDQLRVNGTNGRWAATLNPFRLVWDEITQRYLVAYGFVTGKLALLKSISLISFIAGFAGIAAAPGLRRTRPVRILLLLSAVFFGIQCVFNQKLSYYLVHVIPLYIALFSFWFVWVWDRRPELRWPLSAWLAVLLCVPAAGILLRAEQRSYYAAEKPMLQFLQTKAAGARSIVGSAALLYDMGFDDRLTDDFLLGTSRGSKPDVIVVTPIYDQYFQTWAASDPARFKAVTARLAEYVKAYDADGYRIYVRDAALIRGRG